MKLKIIIVVAFAAVFQFPGLLRAQAVLYPVNDGFELPNLGTEPSKAFKYFNELTPAQLASAGWTFTGSSGIAANNSFFNLVGASPTNHDGGKSDSGQAGFVTATGTISQSMVSPNGGTITVSFALERRSTDSVPNPVEVLVDGKSAGVFNPDSTTSFKTYTSQPLTVDSGSHTITFAGKVAPKSSPVDPTTFIDSVSIMVAPSSASVISPGCIRVAWSAR